MPATGQSQSAHRAASGNVGLSTAVARREAQAWGLARVLLHSQPGLLMTPYCGCFEVEKCNDHAGVGSKGRNSGEEERPPGPRQRQFDPIVGVAVRWVFFSTTRVFARARSLCQWKVHLPERRGSAEGVTQKAGDHFIEADEVVMVARPIRRPMPARKSLV
jgi:hypothetical protein